MVNSSFIEEQRGGWCSIFNAVERPVTVKLPKPAFGLSVVEKLAISKAQNTIIISPNLTEDAETKRQFEITEALP